MRAEISEFIAVKSTVEKYVEAVKAKDHKVCEPFFTNGASTYGIQSGKVTDGNVQELWKVIDAANDTDVVGHIDVLFVDGTIAFARLLEDGWEGYDFSDYFVLIKVEGQWKITTKVWNEVRYKKP